MHVLKNLRTFIELSLLEDEKNWSVWIAETTQSITSNCWEEKKCHEVNCPAYMSKCGRCWLMAGTLCGGEVQGKFAIKYTTCCACNVFQKTVFKDSTTELQEHLLILIHSLRSKQQDLKVALTEVKTLSGLVPICMTCKKIRDDTGYWNQLEAYISKHSEVEFTHGICPECLEKHHPQEYESLVLKGKIRKQW
jgi:hypothetical protein